MVNGGLTRLDSLGNVMWCRGYGRSIHAVTETNHQFIITGQSSGSLVKAVLMRLDSTGVPLWSKTYSSGEGFTAFPTSDSGYFMAGISGFNPLGGPGPDLYIVKADSQRNSGCFQMDVSTKDTLVSLVTSAFSTVIGTAPDNSQFVTTLVGTGGTMNTICSSLDVREASPLPIFRTFPNPAIDVLFIQTPHKPNEQVTVLNVLGASLSIPAKRSGNKLELDIHTLPPGTYLLRYTAPGVSQSAKFQKQ